MEEKRKRSPNFSMKERAVLLEYILVEKDIVDMQKNDASSWREKQAAWKRIEEKFNADSASSCFRNAETIRWFYINHKKRLRKNQATEKYYADDKPFKIADPSFNLVVSTMDGQILEELNNELKSDVCSLDLDSSQNYIPNGDTNTDTEVSNNDWEFYTSPKAKKPRQEKSKPHVTFSSAISSNSPATHEPTKSNLRRRIPVGTSFTRSEISKQYSELSLVKMEMVKLQHEQTKRQLAQDNEIHQLRKRSLELDIEIKNELLKKIKNGTSVSAEDLKILHGTQNVS